MYSISNKDLEEIIFLLSGHAEDHSVKTTKEYNRDRRALLLTKKLNKKKYAKEKKT